MHQQEHSTSPASSDTPQPAATIPYRIPAKHRIWGSLNALAWGITTLILAFFIGVMGFGFADPQACGTAAVAAFVGLWSVLSFRGLRAGRRVTLIGLCLASLCLVWRLVTRFQSTLGSGVVFWFLLPGISIPVGLLWLVLSLAFVLLLMSRLWRAWRSAPDTSESAPAFRIMLGLGFRLCLLVALTLVVPDLAARHRGSQIEELAQRYPREPGGTNSTVTFGACTSTFLGYELTQHGKSDSSDPAQRQAAYKRALGDAQAELQSIVAAGARSVRVGASGDQLFTSKPEQEAVDDQFMAAVNETHLRTVLVDTQHPKALQSHKLDWASFCKFQRDRIAYYTRRYGPDVYFVVCEPLSYHRFCLTPDTTFSADDWAKQLSEMCRLVRYVNPATRAGICLLVGADHQKEWEVWSRMKALPELDILSVEIYGPSDFALTEERLRQYGHPREQGKLFWIAETFNGWALSGGRVEHQDAEWFRVARNFAQKTEADAVLVWTFGTFVPGGSLLDFGNGRLRARWEPARQLSVVGRAFAELATATPGSVTPTR